MECVLSVLVLRQAVLAQRQGQRWYVASHGHDRWGSVSHRKKHTLIDALVIYNIIV